MRNNLKYVNSLYKKNNLPSLLRTGTQKIIYKEANEDNKKNMDCILCIMFFDKNK